MEGWASEARAGLDRDPVGAASVDGGVGAEETATSEDNNSSNGDGDEALDAFVSAVVASTTAVDEGELTCRQLEGVVSREAGVAGRRILLRVANLDDYFAIAGEPMDLRSMRSPPVHAVSVSFVVFMMCTLLYSL